MNSSRGRKGPLRSPRRRGGMSLLETILAIAILGGALATLGALIRVGARAAAEAQDLTVAQTLCETRVSEVAIGTLPLAPSGLQMCPETPEWSFALQIAPLEQEGLFMVVCTVQKNGPSPKPTSFTLSRRVLDPGIEYAEIELEEQEAAEEAAAEEEAAAAAAATPATGGGM